MARKILIGITAGLILLLALSFIPFKTFMVNDKWVYGVEDMREIYPEIHPIGYDYGNGITLISQESYQSMKLNFWQYLSAKRNGAIQYD